MRLYGRFESGGSGIIHGMDFPAGIRYEESARSRGVTITVRPGGEVVVRHARHFQCRRAEEFVATKSGWILRSIARQKDKIPLPRATTKHFEEHKEKSREKIAERLAHFAPQYGFSWKSVRIGRQKSRWGSCSLRGVLSFNYLLMFMPAELLDYVVVHELCHLKEHNHSTRFWNLVAQEMPDWKRLRKELRKYQSA